MKRIAHNRHSFETVEKEFKKAGCELLETSYVNCRTYMRFKCPCGEEGRVTWTRFQQGQKTCQNCGLARYKASRRLSFSHVRNYFDSLGCKLLSDSYINNSTNLEYICSCNRVSKSTFAHFQIYKRCRLCGIDASAARQRHSLKYVREFFKSQGCKLLQKTYINCHTPVQYKCCCGEKSQIAFSDFQNGKRCRFCGRKTMADSQRHSIEFVKKCFLDRGCKLIGDYISCNEPVECICSCGRLGKIVLSELLGRDSRCQGCAAERSSETKLKKFFSRSHKFKLFGNTTLGESQRIVTQIEKQI